MADDGLIWRNLYGRRRGHRLRPGQQRLMDQLLPALAVPGADPRDNPDRRQVDLAALFPAAREVWLEIGFGAGEHLAAMAAAHPEIGLIGCEHYVNGVAQCLSALERAGLGNVRLHARDGRDLIDVLPQASIGRVFLLYPDPWPKARHHKRRFVNADNLEALARAMRPGAELRLATDIPDYVDHALACVAGRRDFAGPAAGDDMATPWPGWPGTRYEAKALREGRRPHYLSFRRV